MKTVLLIDGENLKGKIRAVFMNAKKERPKWYEYDFKGLFERVLTGTNIDRRVFYFARIKEHENSPEKSQLLIQDQRRLKTHLEQQGFEVVLAGQVRGQMEDSRDGNKTLVFKENGVDVKIAVDMVRHSCDGRLREIVIVSSDSDLQPAVKDVRSRGVACVYVGFETLPNRGMSYTTDRTILIRNPEALEFAKANPDS